MGRTRLTCGLRWAPMLVAVLALAPQASKALLINNGLAPPEPANVLTGMVSEMVVVRDLGCAQASHLSCPTAGSPTTVAVAAGAEVPDLRIRDTSVLLHESLLSDFISADQEARVHLDGGFADEIELSGKSHLEVLGGGAEAIELHDESTIRLDGDTSQQLVLAGQARGTILGGFSPLVTVGDQAFLEVLGGATFGGLPALVRLGVDGEGVIEVHGDGFELDGVPVPYGMLEASEGMLTGTLLDGDPASFDVFRGENARILLVPELSCSLLVATAALMLARGSRQRA